MSELFDTNILIDSLNGIAAARSALERSRNPAISIISWIEVLVGATENDEIVEGLLRNFEVIHISDEIGRRAARIRRERRMKLPDAIILATASVGGRTLVTRNTRDFPAGERGIRVPYQV